jgi:hypothetical protein
MGRTTLTAVDMHAMKLMDLVAILTVERWWDGSMISVGDF